MHISSIASDRFKVYAVKLDEEKYDSFRLLSGRKQPSNANDRNVIISALRRISKLANSPDSLPIKVCHNISDNIWQITSGQYRILWFYDKDCVIICTHFFVKKCPKTPSTEIDRANRIRDLYFKDKNQGNLVII